MTGIDMLAFDHKHSLRSREFIISWLNHTTPRNRCYASCCVADRLTQHSLIQAACELSPSGSGLTESPQAHALNGARVRLWKDRVAACGGLATCDAGLKVAESSK